jgi:hypothetical protein
MKKSILILGILLPFLSLSQSINKVITTENKVYIGDIYKAYGNNIIFLNGVNPSLKSNRLEIALVKEIYGPLANSTKKAIMKKNDKIGFYPDISFAATEPSGTINNQFSAGEYLQRAGTRYLTGIGIALAGGVVAFAGSASDNPENLALAGGIMVLIGGITSITGHFQLIKAGKVMNGAAITLSPSKEGIGFAINF